VFPRPKDISKAFGGGRNLRPGQELESAEQKAAREAAYSAALKAYREKVRGPNAPHYIVLSDEPREQW
jgi:hypothetical protein